MAKEKAAVVAVLGPDFPGDPWDALKSKDAAQTREFAALALANPIRALPLQPETETVP
jgi:hypothetical protein